MHTDHDSSAYDGTATIADLQGWVDRFAAERNWEQFHRPKNLAMSIAIESAELMEHFQWSDPEAGSLDEETKGAISEEISDVLSYLLRLASVLDLDLTRSLGKKMAKNAQKYPLHEA